MEKCIVGMSIALATKKSKLISKIKNILLSMFGQQMYRHMRPFKTILTKKKILVLCEDISENLVEKLPYVDGFIWFIGDFGNVGQGLDVNMVPYILMVSNILTKIT